MMAEVVRTYPNLAIVATTLRVATSASTNDWSAAAYADGTLHVAAPRPGLEILDRVGGGDSFASGLIYGLLQGYPIERALSTGPPMARWP